MEPAFRHLPKRDGTMIQVPSMPWSSGPTPPDPFRAPCCGQEITGERVSVIQGALSVWQWRYCACMREVLAIAAEERERHEQDVRRRERWEVQQRSLDTLFPQWRQSAKVHHQALANFVVSDETRELVERIKVWMDVGQPDRGISADGPRRQWQDPSRPRCGPSNAGTLSNRPLHHRALPVGTSSGTDRGRHGCRVEGHNAG